VKLTITLALSALLLAQQPTALQTLLTRTSADFPGKAGIWVKHLTTGETAGVRDAEVFNSASVIKIPVLVLAFQMADKGAINLDERVTIRKEDIRGGSGIFRYHDADLAIAKVGGVARVNAWLKESGYGTERLTQTTGELFAKYRMLAPANLSQPTAADLAKIEADSQARTNGDRAYWLGEITPRGIGLMLEGIEKRTIASKAACDDMLRMMRAQQAGARRLNHFLSVPVAHKTGDFPPVLANDVGIIYARSGPIVVSFLGNAITGNYGEAEDRMGRFAQSLVEHFDK
jgi:beta-lactamase class A